MLSIVLLGIRLSMYPPRFFWCGLSHMLGNRLIRSNLGLSMFYRQACNQGVLSRFLWLPVANVGLRRLESRCFKVVAYTDDVVTLVDVKCLSTLGELMEYALGTLSF